MILNDTNKGPNVVTNVVIAPDVSVNQNHVKRSATPLNPYKPISNTST